MKSYMVLSVFICYLNVTFAMNNSFDLQQATVDDVSDIVNLYQTVGVSEQDKIVILPTKFREQAVRSSVDKERLYVARNQEGELVGLKKLFVMKDQEEKHEVLTQELRCNQRPSKLAQYNDSDFIDMPIPEMYSPDQDVVCMYTGGDLTHPDYRGKGINRSLTDKALDDNAELVRELLGDSQTISLAYGITQHNAGEGDAHAKDRTFSIVKSFEPFVQNILGNTASIVYTRFPAFKPSFDQDAQECRPLPDAHSVPGYGCILTAKVQEDDNV